MEQIKELVTVMVEALVDNPDQIEVREIESENSLMYELRVFKSDIGKVIGKQGRNVTALRNIASAAGAKLKKRVIIDIVE